MLYGQSFIFLKSRCGFSYESREIRGPLHRLRYRGLGIYHNGSANGFKVVDMPCVEVCH